MTKTHTDIQAGWREKYVEHLNSGAFCSDEEGYEEDLDTFKIESFIQQTLTQQAEEIFGEVGHRLNMESFFSDEEKECIVTLEDIQTQLQKLKERYTLKSS